MGAPPRGHRLAGTARSGDNSLRYRFVRTTTAPNTSVPGRVACRRLRRLPMKPSHPGQILLEKLLDRMEAFALAHYLDAHGLPVTLAEPPLRGAMGEIPFLETSSELFLNDASRLEEARVLIERFRNDEPGVRGTVWECPGCKEMHEPEFGDCWNCGAVRPG